MSNNDASKSTHMAFGAIVNTYGSLLQEQDRQRSEAEAENVQLRTQVNGLHAATQALAKKVQAAEAVIESRDMVIRDFRDFLIHNGFADAAKAIGKDAPIPPPPFESPPKTG